jgi:peptidoglycan/LPS O-acetylase OafA/YrhL
VTLRIVSAGRRFIPEVDGLRFVAIAAVILYHMGGRLDVIPGADGGWFDVSLRRSLEIGHYGVQLFFVLSGFLLAMPFAKWRLGRSARPSLRTYYYRRITRIEPPYVVAMLLLFAVGIAAHRLSDASKWPDVAQWPNLLASLLYQHNLIYHGNSLINPVAWSLEIEVQFYLLAPLLAVVFSVRRVVWRRAILCAVMIGVPIVRLMLPAGAALAFNSLPFNVEFFAAGFLLADVYLVDWNEAPQPAVLWDALSVAAWALLAVVMLSGRFTGLVALGIFVAYLGAFRGRVSSWILRRQLITTLGGMCYSLYLLHYCVVLAAGRITKHLYPADAFSVRLGIDALVMLPLMLVVSVAFFALIERPCMDPAWPSRLRGVLQGRRRVGTLRVAAGPAADGAN